MGQAGALGQGLKYLKMCKLILKSYMISLNLSVPEKNNWEGRSVDHEPKSRAKQAVHVSD